MSLNDLTNTKMDKIASFVQKELAEAGSLLRFLTDYSSLAGKGIKQIGIPKLDSFSVQQRTLGGTVSANAALTDSKDIIDLDKHPIVLFEYDSHDAFQSTIEYKLMAAERAASAHGRNINSEVLAMWDAVADTSYFGATPTDVTEAFILDSIQVLEENFADMSQAAFVFPSEQKKVLLNIPRFSEYQFRGDGTSPIVNGQLGELYGIPVFINNQIGAKQGYLVAKEGSAIAFSQDARVEEEVYLAAGTGGRRVAVDTDFGLGGLQKDVNGAAAGKTKLIVKMRD